MSTFFSSIFGAPKKPTTSASAQPAAAAQRAAQPVKAQNVSPRTALQQNSEMVENLQKKAELLEAEIQALLAEAQDKLAKGQKVSAMSKMKQKKGKELQLEAVLKNIDNLEQIRSTTETAILNREVIAAIDAGTKLIHQISPEGEAERVGLIHEQLEDAYDNVKETTDALNQPVGAANGYDDDELLAELNASIASPAGSAVVPNAAAAAKVPHLPVAPTGPIKGAPQISEEDAMLAELKASMGGMSS